MLSNGSAARETNLARKAIRLVFLYGADDAHHSKFVSPQTI
jgi:hypothetical protein